MEKKLNESFEGKELERFQDVLEKARTSGLVDIRSKRVDDGQGDMFVFKAKAIFFNEEKNRHETYEAHGDATQENVDFARLHRMRVAETRAIARALRWKVGGSTIQEETG